MVGGPRTPRQRPPGHMIEYYTEAAREPVLAAFYAAGFVPPTDTIEKLVTPPGSDSTGGLSPPTPAGVPPAADAEVVDEMSSSAPGGPPTPARVPPAAEVDEMSSSAPGGVSEGVPPQAAANAPQPTAAPAGLALILMEPEPEPEPELEPEPEPELERSRSRRVSFKDEAHEAASSVRSNSKCLVQQP